MASPVARSQHHTYRTLFIPPDRIRSDFYQPPLAHAPSAAIGSYPVEVRPMTKVLLLDDSRNQPPLAHTPAATVGSYPMEAPPMTKVLLLEDSRTDALLIKSCLKTSQLQCSIVVAETVAEAESLLEGDVDVALIDLNLPDSCGIETVRRIRALRQNLPIVMLSGDSGDETGLQALREGAQDFISKNEFNGSALERSIRFAIERQEHQLLRQEVRQHDQESDAARCVQQRLMLSEFPTIPGFEVAGRCRSADAVGGDFFDLIPWPGNRLGVVVGDVSGHGLPAALLMASTHRVIRTLRSFLPEPNDLMSAANEQICEATRQEQFVEIFLAVIDLETGNASYVGAGHGGVLIKSTGEVIKLSGTGLPAGMTHDLMMDGPGQFKMEPGDLLAVYTDGMYECRSQKNEMLGQDTVIALLRQNVKANLHDLVDSLIEVSCNFSEPEEPSDDITIALVRCTG
jgi:phosphoserine phosphatase RsbU/P